MIARHRLFVRGGSALALALAALCLAFGIIGCDRDRAPPPVEPQEIATTSSAALTGGDAGPTCSGSDPYTGIDGGGTCTGVLGQATFQNAICTCGSLQVSGVLKTDGFDSVLGGPDGGGRRERRHEPRRVVVESGHHRRKLHDAR